MTSTKTCSQRAVMLPSDHHHGAFAQAVLDPRKPVPAGIQRANGADPTQAFNVYRNNVVASLADALKSAFPITSHLLGEGLQRALMADFVRQHPPKSAILSDYGDTFPGFLAQHPATKSKPFLADVALLERRRVEAYHATDAPVFDGAALATLDPQTLSAGVFRVHPAVRLVASRFPIATIQAIETAELDGQDTADRRATVNLRQSERVLLTRPQYEVAMQVLTPGAFAFLKACARHVPFGAAADDGFQAEDTFDLQACLTQCLTAGAFTAFEPAGTFQPSVPHTDNPEPAHDRA